MAKSWLERAAQAIPLSMYRLLIRRDVIGFVYHVISDESLPHIRHLYPYKNLAMFEQDLDYLHYTFHLISYEQLVELRTGKLRLRRPAALLSFDDGLKECFSVIRPVLLKRGIPGLFFINTDGIDNRRMLYRQKISLCIEKIQAATETERQATLTRLNAVLGQPIVEQRSVEALAAFVKWIKSLNYRNRDTIDLLCQMLDIDVNEYLRSHQPYLTVAQIRRMAEEGFTIGAHTRGHPKLNLLTPEEVEDEIAGSCLAIQEITGQGQVPFAFPFSAYGLNREMLSGILSRHHFIGSLFDAKGIRKDKSFIMNRIMVDRRFSASINQSDLPQHLHRAYQDVFLLKIRRRGIA